MTEYQLGVLQFWIFLYCSFYAIHNFFRLAEFSELV